MARSQVAAEFQELMRFEIGRMQCVSTKAFLIGDRVVRLDRRELVGELFR